MPLYTYVCKRCSKSFEILVSFSRQRGEAKCPECGSNNTEKVFGSFSVSGSTKGTSSKCSSCSGGNCSTCS
ncbi:MAG: zinc ribbon domain-containing protein [Candidatus Omnitrophota bacterium]|nr:MAG: zinc ribbon domain-containing protein [Candidatus Omnitrophota bacterium]